jgi:c-di-GMP-binding flagellar brake protein YcgR
MSNKRQFPRLPLPMTVEVTVAEQGTVQMKTRDMSDGGVFLENNENIILLMGVKLTIKVIENMQGEEAAEIPATVVRVTNDGVAVQFDIT